MYLAEEIDTSNTVCLVLGIFRVVLCHMSRTLEALIVGY